ncbi:EF-P 5-aminopentanol modification-associated protein YfmH [Mahella australiensis]|uniref:Peptidase M16 domain protein n=1 Tax=Mahella australiensis (strain DSM 15567 / CIP 107919 / 50-1 BON) TaxID=697281 RepID=F4A2U2_MAHA5|nr:pitrilysin family protein [Mahella australiensis]AEE97285.1 peptidase M16 domain protein [Mahella australiensis 50-1 BON]
MTVIENSAIEERIYKYKLDNGLTVFIMPKPGYTKQFAIYATNYGSNDIKFLSGKHREPIEVPCGIAHFLEHKLFEEQGGSIFERFSALGAQANAFTNFNMTAYLFSSTDKFYDCLELLLGFVNRPYFTDENVEKEKGIIAQEIRMYEDNPAWRVYFNLLGALYKNHPVKNDIAGTVESITGITKEQLYLCYETFYHPDNMAIFIIGDIDKEQVIKTVKRSFKDKNMSRRGDIKRIYPDEPMDVAQPLVKQQLAVAIPMFYIGFKDSDTGMSGNKLMKKDIVTGVLLNMLIGKSSDTYQSLYKDGLINATFEKDYTGEIHYGFSLMGGESQRPLKVQDRIMEAINNYKQSGLNVNDLDRVKRKMLGDFLMSLNRIDGIASAYIAATFKDINLLDYPKVLDDVKISDVEERLRQHFDEKYCAISIIEPKK